MGYFAQAGLILVEFFFGLLIGLFVVRVLLQAVRASFHNPLSQFFYRATNPVLMPLRRFLPPIGRIDSAGVAVAFVLCLLQIYVLSLLFGHPPPLASGLVFAFAALLNLVLTLYFWLIVVRVILSFLQSDPRHPMAPLLAQLTDPVLRPLRRVLPLAGPFDLSPLIATLIIVLARVLVIAPINDFGAWLGS